MSCYSYRCSHCSVLFITVNDNREEAARILYTGIKKHLVDYDEDRKEYEFDDPPEFEVKEMEGKMKESPEKPEEVGYELV